MSSTKIDQEIHIKAIAALKHYYTHRDHTLLTRIARQFPNSNRWVAFLKWVQKFSALRWNKEKNSFIYQRTSEEQDISTAENFPFWELKIKQEQRRHTSGNIFDQDLFFEQIVADINKNIDEVSIKKLETFICSLKTVLIIKNKKLSARKIQSNQSNANHSSQPTVYGGG